MPDDELVAVSSGRAFANKNIFLPAWFPMLASRALRAGKATRGSVGPVEMVLWRDDKGTAHAFEAHCPHLGADLGFGSVVEGELRCALHHWRFRADGTCSSSTTSPGVHAASSRCAKVFPVIERYGLVFVYPAAAAAIPFPPLPDGDDERDFRCLRLPSTSLACHHHLTTANGLDAMHLEGLHNLELLSPWEHRVDAASYAVHLTTHHRHRNRLLRAVTGDLRARFSAHGPSIAWVTSLAPVRLHVLFCTRPEGDGGSSSRAILFLPRTKHVQALRVVTFLFSLLWQDGRMLNALKGFRPSYVDSDAPVRDFGALLQRWPR